MHKNTVLFALAIAAPAAAFLNVRERHTIALLMPVTCVYCVANHLLTSFLHTI